MCPLCYQIGGSLLHCLSTLTSIKKAVYFCCTGLGVTSTGRYPASCPAKPGLSSSVPFRLYSRDHLACLHECYSNTNALLSKEQILYIKTTSTHKLSQKRIMRDIFTRNRNEVIKEFQKSLRFQIFRFTLIDSKKKRLCIYLKARKLIYERGIKHYVRLFLIRENICFLSSSDRRPSCDRLLCRSASRTCITYNSADQTTVRCRNTVMLINI